MIIKLDDFTQAYIEAALWSSQDDDNNPLDAKYGMLDLSKEILYQMMADCAKFQRLNKELLIEGDYLKGSQYNHIEIAGHDFWLTRNRHGAGFWDGDWEKVTGEKLSASSKTFGEFDLIVGDDGLIYS